MWCHSKTLNHLLPFPLLSPPLVACQGSSSRLDSRSNSLSWRCSGSLSRSSCNVYSWIVLWCSWNMINACCHEGRTRCIFPTLLKTWPNSKLFVCANVGVHQGVLFFIDHNAPPRVQQVLLLVLINLCSSTTITITLVHPFLVWMLVLFNYYSS